MPILDINSLIELYDEPYLDLNMQVLRNSGIVPGLIVVATSADSGAKSYIRGMQNICQRYGINFRQRQADSAEQLFRIIDEINGDKTCQAAIVLYPTPFALPDRDFMNHLAAMKDVEGLHFSNMGYLVQFKKYKDNKGLRKLIIPPTAKGILYIIRRFASAFAAFHKQHGVFPGNMEYNPYELSGKKVTIVNDSLAVGKSLALMLMNANASVRVCQKYTEIQDIYQFTRLSDFIITAVPAADWHIPVAYVPPQAIVFDIAFSGNFLYPDIIDACAAIAPRWDQTEKGNRINDMTLTRLVSNTLYLANDNLPDVALSDLYKKQREIIASALHKHVQLLADY
jgi:methylenetetrahydrofolate dehydrogenase (NADP+)/methenyltetrahydrofolate cyclohydrolase